jgi:hypothetical protein
MAEEGLGKEMGMRRVDLSLITAGPLEDPGPGRSTDVIATVLGSLVGSFSVFAFAWLAVLGFAGGTVPVLGWALPGGLIHGARFLAVLATGGVIVLWIVPLAVAMALYAVLCRMAPALARAPRPRRAADRRHDRPVGRAA